MKEREQNLNRELGYRVRLLREKLGLSRKDLAERIDISIYFLIEIETGRKGVSNTTLCKLSEALCTTTDYLLTGRETYSDISTVASMLTTIDLPLIKGAENILLTYLGNISYIKEQVNQEEKDDLKSDYTE